MLKNLFVFFLFLLMVLISSGVTAQNSYGTLDIPPRPTDAPGGAEFMESVKNKTFATRENAILEQFLAGNIPDFMRELVEITANWQDAGGNNHEVSYRVLPDYLAIGSNTDFCRVPMGPITAQKIADAFGACMPTRKLVDNIYSRAEVKLAPVTYAPVGNANEQVEKFIEHNTAIQGQFETAGGVLGELTGGTKKDVVISNKIIDESRPNHVVIYGWHRLNGNPIQPLTNIHIDTYVDYSHGIRLIDSDIILDGDTTTVQEVLKDEDLYKVLSDETGVMRYPTYIYEIKTPDKPSSFGLRINPDGKPEIVISPDPDAESYFLYTSYNGVDFDFSVEFYVDTLELNGFSPDSVLYIRLKAVNEFGESEYSEVLAVYNGSANEDKMLLVNGFDRTSTGNSFNFVRQHSESLFNNGVLFESATNEAIVNGLFALGDYEAADYILGDESTADETFSSSEQVYVKEFLEAGGRLFVAGSEIAWDLDYKGSSTDKAFIKNYLKAAYSADAPGNVSSTYFSAMGTVPGIFTGIDDIKFDNGSHGTIAVNYADALTPRDNAEVVLKYKGVSSHSNAGIKWEGIFGSGSEAGKVLYMGFPFETIYPAATRDTLMGRITGFLFSDVVNVEDKKQPLPGTYKLAQNYPNPFNPETRIDFVIPESGYVKLEVFNSLGEKVAVLADGNYENGSHTLYFTGKNLASGIYYYTISTGNFRATKKMALVK